MKILLRFSQEYIELTKKEFEQLMQCKLKNYKLKEIGKGYFIINTESPNSKEIIQKISQNSHYLALTKGIWEILFKSETNSEEKVIKETIHRKKTTAESNFRQTTKSLKSSKDHNIDKKIIDKLQKSNIKEELLYQIISKSRTISWNKIIRGKYAVRIKKIKQSSSNTIKKSIKKHNRNNSIEKENKNNRHQNIQPAKTFNANQFQIAFSDIIWTFLNESNNKHNKQLSQKKYDSKENNNTNATETRRNNMNNKKKDNNIKEIPQVSINNPDTKINIFYIDEKSHTVNQILVTKTIYENKERFIDRRADKRPCLKPISLHPKLARTCINLLGLQDTCNSKSNKKKLDCKTIIDPCCGTGGFLIEAGLMGYNVIGFDNIKEMIECTERNLKYYGLTKYKLYNVDTTKIKTEIDKIWNEKMKGITTEEHKKFKENQTDKKTDTPFDGLVTDLPYGKNTKKIQNLENLYFSLLKNFKFLSDRMVIIFPHYIDYRNIIKEAHLKLEYSYKIKIHNKLKRVITIIKV